MRRSIAGSWVLALGCLAVSAVAQEGFPLDGTWRGAWRADASTRTPVVIVMKWDGTRINGTISPGQNSIAFDSAELDPGSWTLQIEAHTVDGAPIHIVARLYDLGSYHRRLEGTWTQSGAEHAFAMRRE
jgi:hypothetical protein